MYMYDVHSVRHLIITVHILVVRNEAITPWNEDKDTSLCDTGFH